jgi:GNAT superfamily N-acetyltransferase
MDVVAVTAGGSDVLGIEDTLRAAFWDDPVSAWLLPGEASRSRRLAWFFRIVLLQHYMPMRTVWTTPDQAGAALWAPPGHWMIEPREMLGAWPLLLRTGGRHSLRAAHFLDYVDRAHPREPHWYLGVLGTSPARQGKGVGSALLQPVLNRCDEEGVPAYLESSKESNVPFYRRHGFERTGEIRDPRGGPVLYPMWREPRPAST